MRGHQETLPFERDIADFLACSRRLRQRKQAERKLLLQEAKDTLDKEHVRDKARPPGSPRDDLSPEASARVAAARSLTTADLTFPEPRERGRLGEAEKAVPRRARPNLGVEEAKAEAKRVAIEAGKKKAMEKMARHLAESSPPRWAREAEAAAAEANVQANVEANVEAKGTDTADTSYKPP